MSYTGLVWQIDTHVPFGVNVAFAEDAPLLVANSGWSTRVIDCNTGGVLSQFAGKGDIAWHTRFLTDALNLPVFTIGGYIWLARVGADAKPPRVPPKSENPWVADASISSNGEYVTTITRGGRVEKWQARTGARVQRVADVTEYEGEFEFSPSGNYLRAAYPHCATTEIWRLPEMRKVWERRGPVIRTCRFSDRYTILRDDGYLVVCDTATGEELSRQIIFAGDYYGLLCMGEDTLLTHHDDRFVTLALPDLRVVRQTPADPRFGATGAVLTHDARRVLLSCALEFDIHAVPAELVDVEPDELVLYDLVAERELARFRGLAGVRSLALSPDERLAATSGADGVIRLFRLPPP